MLRNGGSTIRCVSKFKPLSYQFPKSRNSPIHTNKTTQPHKMLRRKSSSRKPKTMKPSTPQQTSSSSSTGSTSCLRSDNKDNNSCYFPGCRKDANCKCEICIESMNATLDLMPQSTQRSVLTRDSSTGKSKISSRNAIPFNPLSPFTPKSKGDKKSSSKMGFEGNVGKEEGKKRGGLCGFVMRRFLMGLGVFLVLEFGVSWMVSGFFQPEFSVDVVRISGEKSMILKDLNQRLGFLKNELQGLVDSNVTDCTAFGSNWKLNQDGLLLYSKCVLYKSMSEEISIWGWPLQTAGLLTADFSSRSFTVLSGRVTEWTNGRINYIIHKTNTSFGQHKWDSSAVQLDAKTWILEYNQRYTMENARLVSAALEFMKFRMRREIRNMKQEFWQAFGSWSHHPTDLRLVNSITPT